MQDLFGSYWLDYSRKTLEERSSYFNSLSRSDRLNLIKSFWESGWKDLIIHNFISQFLDNLKEQHNIDVYNIRVAAIKHNRVFLIEKDIWDSLLDTLNSFKQFYDISLFIGDLQFKTWGKSNQFYRVTSIQNGGNE